MRPRSKVDGRIFFSSLTFMVSSSPLQIFLNYMSKGRRYSVLIEMHRDQTAEKMKQDSMIECTCFLSRVVMKLSLSKMINRPLQILKQLVTRF